jgi:hypothetical protein
VSEQPTDPVDPTRGPEVRLTPDQFDMLIRCVPKKHGGVRLRDLGGARVEIEVLDAGGNVMKSRRLLPPPADRAPSPTSRRFLKERDQGEQK